MAVPSRFDANGTPKQRKGNEGSSWPLKGPRKHEEKDKRGPGEALRRKIETEAIPRDRPKANSACPAPHPVRPIVSL